MSSPGPSAFTTANPHALACILEAAETRQIISATDIFDARGIKLWAANQPVSAELQRKLADRTLREPLETSLVAEDGVRADDLVVALQALVDGDGPLGPVLRPQADRLEREVAQLTLQPAVQLLLTASQAARPDLFDHAVSAMALNGALMAAAGGDTPELRTALLAGLLHDIGEMYIAPRFGEASAERDMDFTSYQQLVVHPHVGFLLIRQLTQYASSVAIAVGQHHERLDGSGYPRALRPPEITPQARLLAVTEAALHAMRERDAGAGLLHASVALRAVPGEFDAGWAGEISRAARGAAGVQAVMAPEDIQARLEALTALLTEAEAGAQRLRVAAAQRPALAGPAELAGHLLARVRVGWNESGLWSPQTTGAGNAAEVEAVEDELYRRLRAVQRVTRLQAGDLPPAEAAVLAEFCDRLEM